MTESRGSELDELLAAYADVRREARSLPAVLWVRAGSGRIGARIRVPLARAFLPFLLTHRLTRVLSALSRKQHERAALADGVEQRERDLRRLEHFMLSLPNVPYRRLAVAFLLSVLLVAYVLSSAVFDSESDARGIARALDGVLTLDPNAATDAVRSFELEGALGAAFTLALALLVVSAPVGGSFRLLRLLLNRHPAGRAGAERESVAEHGKRTTGVYILEERAFAAAGARPPPEWPLDLIVRALALMQPIWFALVLTALGALAIVDGDPLGWALAAAAGVVLAVILGALAETRRTARLRASPAAAAAPRRRTRPLRVAAVAALVLGVAAAAASLATPTVAPQPTFVQISSATLDPDMPRREYLELMEMPLGGFTPPQLAARGLLVTCRMEVRAEPDEPIELQLELHDARTMARVDATSPITMSPRASREARGRQGVDPKKLVLLRLSGARRSVPADAVEAQFSFWLLRPSRSGLYFATVSATQGAVVVEQTKTEPFEVAES